MRPVHVEVTKKPVTNGYWLQSGGLLRNMNEITASRHFSHPVIFLDLEAADLV